jgi:outer membrane protein assembly factor BamB
VSLVLVALFASTSLLGRPVGYPDAGAAAWLPPDGTRERYAGPGGTIVAEWALDRAVALLGSGPLAFYTWMSESRVNWQTAALARLSAVYESSTGAVVGREDDLFSVATDGVRAEAEVPSDGATRIYLPGRLDVPAGLSAGAAWTSTGTVLEITGSGSQRLPYRADYSARRPADDALLLRGCVEVTMRERFGDRDETTSEITWCRQAGILSFRGPAGEWTHATATPAAPRQPDAGFDWGRAEQLTITPLAINHVGTVGGTLVSPFSAPGLLPDGTIVFNNDATSQDLLALDPATDPPPVRWRARPGGRITASTTAGGITLAAGGDRALVAYGPDGQWLWHQRLSDLAVVNPAVFAGLVVVPTLDGRVTAFDLASGAPRWTHTVSAEVRVAPVATADRVLMADQSGQLTCLDRSGSTVWTADVGRVERFTVWTPPDGQPAEVVVPESASAHVRALSLADGSRLWRVREFANVRDVIALDRVVVLRDTNESVGIDPLTGARVWSWSAERTYAGVGGGARLLLLAANRLVLLDDTGTALRDWPVAVGDPSASTTFLVAAQQRVLVYGTAGVELGALP